MPQFYPLALLHVIVVGAHYRVLSITIESWKRNRWEANAVAHAMSTWLLSYRANLHRRETLAELTRVMNSIPRITPRVAKALSSRN